MLYLSKSALLTALLACNAQARELSFELIAGYEPTTVVTDHVSFFDLYQYQKNSSTVCPDWMHLI